MSNSLIASDKQLLHRELFVRLSGAYFPRYWSLEILRRCSDILPGGQTQPFLLSSGLPNDPPLRKPKRLRLPSGSIIGTQADGGETQAGNDSKQSQ